MRKVVVEFDEQTFKRLEQVAADSSRGRSDFIRGAVRRALWELEGERAPEDSSVAEVTELESGAVRRTNERRSGRARAKRRR
jgi:metal-responsive CopG/Arc/MetJ family transcriptional regulator